jgi:iron complex outermembrane receptor protein
MERSMKKWLFSIGLLSAAVSLRAQPSPLPPGETQPSQKIFRPASSPSPTTQPATQPAIPQRIQNGRVSPSRPAGTELADLSLDDLMNVEVTSVSKQPQRIADAPASVTVIGQNDIQRSGLNTIPDLLSLAPGMDVQRINANQWAVSARGFNGQLADDLLVLMDGRSIYTPTFGGVLWNTVDYPLADLDRIEVIRGPGATLWGSNAVNGVVNIITKPADQTQGVLLESRIGTDESDGSVRYGGKIDDLTFFRVYTKFASTGSQPTSDGDLDHDQYDSLHLGFRVDRYMSPTDTLTLQGAFNEQQIKETYLGTFGGITDGDASNHGGNLLARWARTDSERESTSLQLSYTRQDEVVSPYGFQEAEYNLDFQNRFPLGERQQITWGAGGRESQIIWGAEPPADFEPKDRSLYLINGFVQDQVSIVPDRLDWSAGTKVEYNNLTQFEFDPSTRLAWTPDKQNTVWAAISRSTRIPSLYQESRDTFGAITITPDHPASEKTMSYELGYKVQPYKTVTLDATGFYNTYKGLILDAPSRGSPLNESWINAADAQSSGAELALTWQVNPQWKLAGSYTLLDVVAARAGSGSATVHPDVIAAIEGSGPQNQFQVHSYYDLTRAVQLNASGYFVEGLPKVTQGFSRTQDVGSYFRLDLGVTWKPRDNMSFSVGVQNLLQKRHAESGNLGLPLISSEVPRSAYAQFEIKF